MDIKELSKSAGLGIVGYFTPRFLVGLGVPLDDWAEKFGQYLAGYGAMISGDKLITILGVIIGFILITIELWLHPLSRLFKGKEKKSFSSIDNIVDSEYTPLAEAARSLYEDLRGFDKSHKQIVMAESGNNSPEKILEYFAITIALHAEIFGKRPPSSKLEKLPPKIEEQGQFINNCNEFLLFNKKEPEYIDLTTKPDDMPKVLDWLKENNSFGIFPNIEMGEAVKYLVNILFPDKIEGVGNIDIEDTKAVNLITAKLRSGELKSWGRYIGEAVEREFNEDEWSNRELLPLEASLHGSNIPQARSTDGTANRPFLTMIRLNFNQVKRLWPKTSEGGVKKT